MKSGTCPKCGSTEIYVGNGPHYGTDSNNYFVVLKRIVGSRKIALLRRYICSDCNYMETYIADDESMKHIRDEFEPLNKTKPKNE